MHRLPGAQGQRRGLPALGMESPRVVLSIMWVSLLGACRGQRVPRQNTPLWRKDYIKPKVTEKWQTPNRPASLPLLYWKGQRGRRPPRRLPEPAHQSPPSPLLLPPDLRSLRSASPRSASSCPVSCHCPSDSVSLRRCASPSFHRAFGVLATHFLPRA